MNELSTLDRDYLPEIAKTQMEILETARLSSPIFRSGLTEFQVRTLLIGREYSGFGQYKITLVEMGARIENLERLCLSRERVQIDIDELQEKIEKEDENSYQRRRLGLDLIEKKIEFENLLRKIDSLESELGILAQVLSEFSEEDKIGDEVVYYERKLRREVGLNLALNQPLSMNLIENCLNMPEGCEIRQWMETQVHQEENGVEESDGQ